MVHVVVTGAGPAGLSTALFLARRGHDVTLVEKDGDPAPLDPELCSEKWTRRGVPQARQPHALLARSSLILRSEAPDVLDALGAAGAHFVTANLEPVDPQTTDRPFLVASRRPVFEATLRRVVLAEERVRWICGVAAEGLILKSGGATPSVQGVRLESGEHVRADLTVDATGRHSPIPNWLLEANLGPVEEDFQECGFCYMTQWYRLKPGEGFPPGIMPLGVLSPYASFYGFLGDANTFALGIALSVRDPLAAAVKKPAAFERVLANIPATAAWHCKGIPLGAIHVLGRIENRSRTLLKDGAPIVTGLVLVGDSAIHTNPSAGRGVSMAYMQGQQIAHALSEQDPQSKAFALEFETWRTANLGFWFDNQVRQDSQRVAAMDAALNGEMPEPRTDLSSQFSNAVMALTSQNPAVAKAAERLMHMLTTPAEFAADPEVQQAVMNYIADGGAPARMKGPTRDEFVALVSA